MPPYALGDTAGFWESKSNLAKGLHLRQLLESAGATVIMSRVQNRTIDDRPLSAIAEEANVNQSDFMISIHSNAHNSMTNYVLMLFHGWDNNPILPQSMQLAGLFSIICFRTRRRNGVTRGGRYAATNPLLRKAGTDMAC